MAEKIRYDIDVNARDGVRELDRLGKAGQKAGKALEEGFDDSASAADKATQAIVEMATKMDAELRDSIAAADALAQALGPELTAKMDVDQVVADLSRMGVTFDEIRADADKFATALKQVDDIKMGQVAAGLDATRNKLDSVRSSGDQSRSVLANLAGNAAQDLGELGGVVGSLGVGIGQLAEYAVDGNVSLKNLAAVAGPMAGLSAALLAVQYVMQGIAKEKAFDTAEVEAYSDAVDEVGIGAAAVAQHLKDVGKFQFVRDTGFGGFGRDVSDATDELEQYGITADEVAQVIAGTDEQTRAWSEALITSQGELEGTSTVIEAVRQGQENYRKAIERTAQVQEVYASGIGAVNQALADQDVALGNQDISWAKVIEDLRDGRIESGNALYHWNRLRTELGLTDTEMAEMAQQKLDEQLEADAAAAEEAATKIGEMRDTIEAAQTAAADYERVVSGNDWGAASAQAAETAINSYFDQFFKAGNEAASQAEAYDNLGTAIDGANQAGLSWFETLFSVDSPEGRAVRQALRELGTTLIPDIQQAYDDAEGDQEQFRRNMAVLGERTLVRLQNELGISRDEANALAQQLGLVPENVQTMYKLIGDEEAKLKLGLLQSAIDALPENVNTQVTQQILLGDYQGALAIVQNYYSTHGATVPVDADFSQAYDALARFAQAVRGAQILANVAANFPSASAAAQSSVSAAAPAAAVSSRGLVAASPVVVQSAPTPVYIQAAVIGNRFEVQRAVTRALRQSQRLNGVRVA